MLSTTPSTRRFGGILDKKRDLKAKTKELKADLPKLPSEDEKAQDGPATLSDTATVY